VIHFCVKVSKEISAMAGWLLSVRRELHKIPEVANQEFKTSAFIKSRLGDLGLEYVAVQTGIVVKIKGSAPTKTIGFRADIDALAIEEMRESDYQSKHKGFMHACGHDMHAAILLGFAKYLCENPPRQNIVLVWQPAEEGGGGGKMMVESGLFGADMFFAVHVNPMLEVGKFTCRSGVSQPGTKRIEIKFKGEGRHAQLRDGTKDALLAGAEFLLLSEKLNTADRLFHVGTFSGGDGANIVSENASARATMRWFDDKDYKEMRAELFGLAKTIEQKNRGKVEIIESPNFCLPIHNTESYVEIIRGIKGYVPPSKHRVFAGDDFSFFIDKFSGAIISLGAQPKTGKTYPVHSNMFHANEDALLVGVELFVELSKRV